MSIESVIKIGKRYGYLPSDFETAHSLVENIESKLFDSVWYNTNHVLGPTSATTSCKGHSICDNDLTPLYPSFRR